MNCLKCKLKSCRSVESCGMESFSPEKIIDSYHKENNQKVIQKAAELVDDGRAGELSRVDELIEFIQSMEYEKPGLAYCYGMEKQAVKLAELFREKGIPLLGISCTAGAHSQELLNLHSSLKGVSCNPLSQAKQMELQGVDLAIQFGLCMGHDVLFNRSFKGDITTLVVKDRVNGHNPLKSLN